MLLQTIMVVCLVRVLVYITFVFVSSYPFDV